MQSTKSFSLFSCSVVVVLCIAFSHVSLCHCRYSGRYTVKVYPGFLFLHGKSYDFTVPFQSIVRLFLLPHNDMRQMYFVVSFCRCLPACCLSILSCVRIMYSSNIGLSNYRSSKGGKGCCVFKFTLYHGRSTNRKVTLAPGSTAAFALRHDCDSYLSRSFSNISSSHCCVCVHACFLPRWLWTLP